MEVNADKARDWVRLFPRHPVFWLMLAFLLVFFLVRRPVAPPSATQFVPIAAPVERIDRETRARQYGWLSARQRGDYQPLVERVAPPAGFKRVPAEAGSFADWLRHLPCRPAAAPVRDYRGKTLRAGDDPAVAAVFELQPGGPRLLHSANMALRLRAEYLWASNRRDALAFHFTSGDLFDWKRFAAGERPTVRGRSVTWKKSARPGTERPQFTAYLETLFPYSSTISLTHDTLAMSQIADPARIVEPGDLFVVVSQPGHAVVVLDVAADEAGGRRVLLGQGGTPPQTFHLLRGPDGSAWIAVDASRPLATPTWGDIPWSGWRRWTDVAPPASSPTPR